MKQLHPCPECALGLQRVRGGPHGLAEHECRKTDTADEAKRKLLAILVERAHDAPLSEVAALMRALEGGERGTTSEGALIAELRSFIARDA